MRPLPIAGKPVFNSICGNTCNRCQLKKNQVINILSADNMQPLPIAGKPVDYTICGSETGASSGKSSYQCWERKITGTKRGKTKDNTERRKTCKRCQARENLWSIRVQGKMQPVPCQTRQGNCQYWARENMQPVPSTEEHATDAMCIFVLFILDVPSILMCSSPNSFYVTQHQNTNMEQWD